jgi:hypothetical protein
MMAVAVMTASAYKPTMMLIRTRAKWAKREMVSYL